MPDPQKVRERVEEQLVWCEKHRDPKIVDVRASDLRHLLNAVKDIPENRAFMWIGFLMLAALVVLTQACLACQAEENRYLKEMSEVSETWDER